MTRPRLIIGLAIPIALALTIALVLFTNHDGTSPPTPTVAASTTPPTSQPAQDQWLTIVRQIVDQRHALYAIPAPERLAEIYDRGCPCYKNEYAVLADLKRRGLHYDDRGVEVQRAKLISRAQQGTPLVAVEVISKEFPKVLKDRKGKVLDQSPGSANLKTVFELIRGFDNRWRVYFLYRPSS
jgi:hypothetical protein